MTTCVRSHPRLAARRSRAVADLLSARRRLRAGRHRGAAAREIAPERIPSPYRELLVHQNDMTLDAGGSLRRAGDGARALARFATARPTSAACCSCYEHSAGRWRWARSGSSSTSSRPGSARRSCATRCRSGASCARRRRLPQPAERVLEVTPNAEMLGVFWMREPRDAVRTSDGGDAWAAAGSVTLSKSSPLV